MDDCKPPCHIVHCSGRRDDHELPFVGPSDIKWNTKPYTLNPKIREREAKRPGTANIQLSVECLEVFVRSEGRVGSTGLGSITGQNDRVLRMFNTRSF